MHEILDAMHAARRRTLELVGHLSVAELERRFLLLCRSSGLPAPVVNAPIALYDHTFVPDFLWPAQRLIAETDGYETHRTREAFEGDRRRDQLLDAARLAHAPPHLAPASRRARPHRGHPAGRPRPCG